MCCFFLISSINAQDLHIADSLRSLLKSRTLVLKDSTEIGIYLDLAYYEPNPTRALAYSQQALEMALTYDNPLTISEAYEVYATNLRLIGEKTEAFEASFKALALLDSLNKFDRISALLLQIGTQYTADENYSEGVKYLQESLRMTRVSDDSNREIYVLINLAETYRLMGTLDSALFFNEQVLSNQEAMKDVAIRAYTEGNTGMVLNAQNELDKAKSLLQSSINALTKLGDLYSVSIYQTDLGELQIKQGFRQKGIRQIEKALRIAEVQNLKEQIRDFSKKLSEYYSKAGDFKKAFQYQSQYTIYKDSLINAENIRQIAQARLQYEVKKREQELENLSLKNEVQEISLDRTNNRLLLFIILAVSFLLISAILYLSYKRKRKANDLLLEKNDLIQEQSNQKELLHRELHHRVKNNLQLIGSIMSLQSSNTTETSVASAMKEGKSRVEALMLIHQNLYKEQHVTHVNFKEYLDRLCQNLRVSYASELDKLSCEAGNIDIKTDDIIPLGLIVNEIVANSVKHKHENKVSIEILFEEVLDGFKLKIKDSGPGGFDLANSDQYMTEGFGTKLIKTLTKQIRGTISAESSEKGTSIQLILGSSIAYSS